MLLNIISFVAVLPRIVMELFKLFFEVVDEEFILFLIDGFCCCLRVIWFIMFAFLAITYVIVKEIIRMN